MVTDYMDAELTWQYDWYGDGGPQRRREGSDIG